MMVPTICCIRLIRAGSSFGVVSCFTGSCAVAPNCRGGAACGLCCGLLGGGLVESFKQLGYIVRHADIDMSSLVIPVEFDSTV